MTGNKKRVAGPRRSQTLLANIFIAQEASTEFKRGAELEEIKSPLKGGTQTQLLSNEAALCATALALFCIVCTF